MENVLIISFLNPIPSNPKKGGFILDQVNTLFKSRTDILFLRVNILPSNGRLFEIKIEERIVEGNKEITFNLYCVFWKFIFVSPFIVYPWLNMELKKRHPNFKPSIIHSNLVFPCGIVGSYFAKKFKAKHIISEHWSRIDSIMKHPLFGRNVRDVYKKSDAIICVSEYLSNQIRLKTGNKNVYKVPNIVDNDIFKYGTSNKLNDNILRFLIVAAWTVPKRLDLIFESLEILANQLPKKIELHIAGSGPLLDKMLQKLNTPHITVKVYGFIDKSELAALLMDTDIFLHASDMETFSIVTAEALAVGTPVMVSNVGALPELITSYNGILVDNKLESWVEGLKHIIGMKFDRYLIADKCFEKYSGKIFANNIEKIYQEVLHKTINI